MTNGEKIQSMFPNMNFGTLAQDDVIVNRDYSNNDEPQVFIPKSVWNAEYKEQTTENDLGVENDLVSSIVEKISEKVTETHEEFIFETIRPYCEDVVQMKISKRDLEQALLKYYGKNNLGADCVARQDVERFIEGFINKYTPKEELEFINLELDGLKHLPPVTPIRPKGHWIDTNNHQYYNDGYIETTELRCSCCNEEVEWDIELPHKPYFCENCGADMGEMKE